MSDEQLTRDDLESMTHEEIVDAGAAGRLDDLFDRARREREQLGRDDLRSMEPAAIRDALKDGRLDDTLRGEQ